MAVRSWARWATGRLLAVAAGGHETTPRQPLARRRRMTRQRRTPCPELMTPTRSCAKPSNITWPPEHRRTLTHSRSRSSALQRSLRPWPRYGLRGDAWCLHAYLFLGSRPSSRSAAEVAPGVRLDKWGRGPTWAMDVPAVVCALLGHQPAPSRVCSSLPPTHDQAYLPSSAALPASPSSRGRNVSTMTASSSKNSAPIERS